MYNTLEEKYLHDSKALTRPPEPVSGRVEWECPSNIALVKYWGKKPVQLPLNPSVSFTLQESKTILSVEYNISVERKGLVMHYFLSGKPVKSFEDRFHLFLSQVSSYLPFLNQSELVIRAGNTFPHSSGIASSASSFGALALCLCSMESIIFGTLPDEREFREKSSFLSRVGSGSACRSVFEGFSIWGRTDALSLSSDEVAISLNSIIHPTFKGFCDSILVIYTGIKSVSSSTGHRRMEQHPFLKARIEQASANLIEMLSILERGDETGFIALVEEEALTLHAMMMVSRPGYLLLKPNTIEAIERITQFRADTRLPVCFTLDAGANVHFLYPARIQAQVRTFISSCLEPICEAGMVIHDEMGKGPARLV